MNKKITFFFLLISVFSSKIIYAQQDYEKIITYKSMGLNVPVLVKTDTCYRKSGTWLYNYYFDKKGRLKRCVAGDGTTTYKYNKWGFLAEIKGRENVTFEFDHKGRIKVATYFYSYNHIVDWKRVYEYSDSVDRIHYFKGDQLESYSSVFYDSLGREARYADLKEDGTMRNENFFYFDGVGKNPTSNLYKNQFGDYDSFAYRYDKNGNEIEERHFRRNGYLKGITTRRYDEKSRLVWQLSEEPDYDYRWESTYNYNENSLESEIQKSSDIEIKKYNSVGKPVSEETRDLKNDTIKNYKYYFYDSSGRLIRTEKKERDLIYTVDYLYDKRGNPIIENELVNGQFSYRTTSSYRYGRRKRVGKMI